jgi:hypothetical protein
MSGDRFVPVTNLARLRQLLCTYFDDSELRDLCFDLGVDYESLPGEGKGDKARELIAYLGRRGCISRLIKKCASQRPHVYWGATKKKRHGTAVPPRSIYYHILPQSQ